MQDSPLSRLVPPLGPEDAWAAAVDDVLAHPAQLELVFQPIVSLQDVKIVGYEALSRFRLPPDLPPDLWFAAADWPTCSWRRATCAPWCSS